MTGMAKPFLALKGRLQVTDDRLQWIPPHHLEISIVFSRGYEVSMT
jgi:hypothetical protein